MELSRAEYDRYRKELFRRGRWVVLACVTLAVAGGYTVGLASSLLIGAAVTLALLVLVELGWSYTTAGLLVRRFPELRAQSREWRYDGLFVKRRVWRPDRHR